MNSERTPAALQIGKYSTTARHRKQELDASCTVQQNLGQAIVSTRTSKNFSCLPIPPELRLSLGFWANWAPDSWAPGPSYPGPNCPPWKSGKLGPGARLTGAQCFPLKSGKLGPWTVWPRTIGFQIHSDDDRDDHAQSCAGSRRLPPTHPRHCCHCKNRCD